MISAIPFLLFIPFVSGHHAGFLTSLLLCSSSAKCGYLVGALGGVMILSVIVSFICAVRTEKKMKRVQEMTVWSI
uniref:DNA damage-regulated autophagy modulator protein 2 n=1 Tax=Steinernema glaseri TaxID=37863 RepID=A0A1I7YJ80_9BILA